MAAKNSRVTSGTVPPGRGLGTEDSNTVTTAARSTTMIIASWDATW
jgi:hypothetical protein